MKQLSLVALMASAVALTASAADTSYCMLGVVSDPLQYFSAGDRKVGTVCSVPENSALQFNSNTYPLTSGEPATIELTLSNVGNNGMVWIRGLESEAAASRNIPLHVRVANVIFNDDAMLAIDGHWPKNSEIIVSACTFSVKKPQTPFVGLGVYGILFFQNGPQRFYDNSVTRILDNTITVTSEPSNYTGMGIGCVSELKLDSGSHFEVSRNTINLKNTEGGTKSAFGIGFSDAVSPQGSNVTFVINQNTLSTAYATPLYLPAMNSPSFEVEYNVTKNKVTASPGYAVSGNVILSMFRDTEMGGNSALNFVDNSFTATNSDALAMFQKLTLNDHSVVNVVGNIMNATNGTSSFGFAGAVSLPSNAQLIVEANTLNKVDNGLVSLPPVYIGSTFSVQGSSLVSVSNNAFDAKNHDLSNRQYFIGKSTSDSVAKGDDARFYVCSNSHYGEAVTSAVVSSTVWSAVQPNAECGVRTTTLPPTTSTTTATTTTTGTTTPQAPETRPRTTQTTPRPTTTTSTTTTGATTTTVPATTVNANSATRTAAAAGSMLAAVVVSMMMAMMA